MEYQPFVLSEHPKLREMLEKYELDFMTQRYVKNVRYRDGILSFQRVVSLETIDMSIDLKDLTQNFDELDTMTRKALRFALFNLDQADRIDLPMSEQKLTKQLDVSLTFRYFHQYYGGYRYVALCHNLIQHNLGESIHPYMFEDLVFSVYNSYNKSSNRDITGLIDGTLELMEEFAFDDETLKRLYGKLGTKSSEDAYQYLAKRCLSNEALAPSMRSLVVDTLTMKETDPRKIAPPLPTGVIASFPSDDLILIFQKAPGGLKRLIKGLFETVGCQEAYVEAYMQNRERDMNILYDIPSFQDLPPKLKNLASRGKIFSRNARKIDIIEYYRNLGDDSVGKQEVIHACQEYGFLSLAQALNGEPFSFVGFSVDDVRALVPLIDIHSPEVAPRMKAFLKQLVVNSARSPAVNGLFLSLDGEDYADSVEYALRYNYIQDRAVRLCLADRFHLLDKYGYKEWRYHA